MTPTIIISAPLLTANLPPLLGPLSIVLIVVGVVCISVAVVWQWRINHER